MMTKGQSHLTERILNLTLEIMYLLTGEDYIVVKLFEDVTPGRHLNGNGDWNRVQSPITKPLSCSLKPKGNHEERILELTNRMIELLTGEVPIRYQDVAVYLSMEEREYLEEHQELYRAAMMEEEPLAAPDLEKTSEEHLIKSQDDDPAEEAALGLPSSDMETIHSTFTSLDLEKTSEEHLIKSPGDDPEESNVSPDPEDPIELKVPPEFLKVDLSPSPPLPEESSSDRSYAVTSFNLQEFVSVDRSPEKAEEPSLIGLHNVPPTPPNMESPPDPGNPPPSYGPTDGPVTIRVKIYTCPECGKCFPKNTELTRHLRTHTGERPYTCPECNKSFTQNANLVRHQRIHTGVKPFACPECGKCFSGKSDVTRHQKVHQLKKPWTCYSCSKSFIRESDFIRHQDTHTQVPREFTCFLCGLVFHKKILLDRHMKFHTGS